MKKLLDAANSEQHLTRSLRRSTFVAFSLLLSQQLACNEKNPCEQAYNASREWAERCCIGCEMDVHEDQDIPCSEADADVSRCALDCYNLPCDTAQLNECLYKCAGLD